MKTAKRMSKKELMEYTENHHYLTVGQLKKFIEENNIPDSAPVVVERVLDMYYEQNNWTVYPKPEHWSGTMMRFNERLKNGEFDDTEQYPLMTEEMKKPYSQEDIDNANSEYTPAFCAVRYLDEPDVLFLNLHY